MTDKKEPVSIKLDISWDPTKAKFNLDKHGVTFVQASSVLLDPLALTAYDFEHSQFEERWFTLGLSSEGALLAISHTYEPTSQTIVNVRVISAREATKRERLQYENEPQ